MLDPVTALAVVTSVVQFVDFSSKVISKAVELSRSANGTTQDASNYEIVTRDLLRLSEGLRERAAASSAERPKTEADQALNDVCNGCISLSETMLEGLEGLKVQDGAGKISLFGRAVKSVWSRSELKEMALQLATYREQLELHVLVSLR
jgi:hypothetical protein